MKFEITENKDNPLLKRKELRIHMESEKATPPKSEIIARVTAQLSVPNELIVVETVQQRFGSRESEAYVKVYADEESLKAAEPQKKEKAGDEKKEVSSSIPDESGQIKVDLSDDKPAEEVPAEEKKEAPAKEEKKEGEN